MPPPSASSAHFSSSRMTNGHSCGDTCHWKVSPRLSITLFSGCPAWATEPITATEAACTNYTARWDASVIGDRERHGDLAVVLLSKLAAYCRATPTECLPFLGKLVSSKIHALVGPERSIVGNVNMRILARTASSDHMALPTKCNKDLRLVETRAGSVAAAIGSIFCAPPVTTDRCNSRVSARRERSGLTSGDLIWVLAIGRRQALHHPAVRVPPTTYHKMPNMNPEHQPLTLQISLPNQAAIPAPDLLASSLEPAGRSPARDQRVLFFLPAKSANFELPSLQVIRPCNTAKVKKRAARKPPYSFCS